MYSILLRTYPYRKVDNVLFETVSNQWYECLVRTHDRSTPPLVHTGHVYPPEPPPKSPAPTCAEIKQ